MCKNQISTASINEDRKLGAVPMYPCKRAFSCFYPKSPPFFWRILMKLIGVKDDAYTRIISQIEKDRIIFTMSYYTLKVFEKSCKISAYCVFYSTNLPGLFGRPNVARL